MPSIALQASRTLWIRLRLLPAREVLKEARVAVIGRRCSRVTRAWAGRVIAGSAIGVRLFAQCARSVSVRDSASRRR